MDGKFHLGKFYDLSKSESTDQPFYYDPTDLTTHAVVIGMTGSGKTGLCITLMEEAALQGIPAILIDPKGDLTNLLLHFPNLAPHDFQPWLDPDLARRAGKSIEQASAEAALAWRNGLAEANIGREELLALKNAAQYAVYTPGSDAGIPVNILSSLASPGLKWDTHREALAGRISSTVTAILSLAGYSDLDPIRSREHILLATIFQAAWSRNVSLDLTELILQIQTPPFETVGAFPVDDFYPAKGRMELALQINNILAAPGFEIWRTGQPLDIAALLQTPDGRPRHSIFYIAHLPDAERMFFVTLLLTSVEAWMRSQAGTDRLRALLYMDEIYGYLPPTRNPASKQPLLRMVKQARAFGLGLLLATQNPVDLDYKALSNAGTWFIGKLQTDQDKQRLLDGLESATTHAPDRANLDAMISSLGKRVFIMNNVHQDKPVVFKTRWAMNFLAGPITRAQIPALNALVGASFEQAEKPYLNDSSIQTPARMDVMNMPAIGEFPGGSEAIPFAETDAAGENEPTAARSPASGVTGSSQTRPAVPAGIGEYFLPCNLSFPRAVAAAGENVGEGTAPSSLVYHPAIAASAQVRFFHQKYHLDQEVTRSALVINPGKRGAVRWEDHLTTLPDVDGMDPAPDPRGRFLVLGTIFSDGRMMTTLQKDFIAWVTRTSRVVIRANETLGLYATPEVSQAEFMKACAEAARQARDAAVKKATAPIERQIKTLKDKIAREERELKMDETELSQRKGEELATHAENILGVFGGARYRRLSTSLTKRRLTEQAKDDVRESVEALAQYEQELQHLEATLAETRETAAGSWGEVVSQITEIPLAAKKTDIRLILFGVAWVPYYHIEEGNRVLEISAFTA